MINPIEINPMVYSIHNLMNNEGFDCYLIFNSDVHLNEMIRECDMKVKEISGFAGSNGTLVICRVKKEDITQNGEFNHYLLTDSRYTIQAVKESRVFKLNELPLSQILKEYKNIAFDFNTISSKIFKKLQDISKNTNMKFIHNKLENKN